MSEHAITPPTSEALDQPEHWTARYGKPVLFLILALISMGAYVAFYIPVAVFPATDFPRIVIGADNGVAPIDQMLVTVTKPIEEAVNTVPGLQSVKSVTSRGSAEIDLFFSWNVDMFQTLQRVDSELARVQTSLPAGTNLTANRLTFAAFPVMGYSITSDTAPQTRLWELATYELKPRLNRLNGVATVVVQGGQQPEFEIRVAPARMQEAAVTVPAILDAVRRSNVIDSPGLVESNHQLVLGLVSGQVRTPEEISRIVVKTTAAGLPVRIGDVATVLHSIKPVYTTVTANGKPAVLLNINRQPDSNTMAVAAEVHGEIEAIRKSLPPGIQLQAFYDQSEIVGDSIRSVRDAILIGLVLASAILVLFLRDWGTSLVAGLVIPATIALTFIGLKIAGQSFDLMSLGGLAAAVGLVIDDAIVVVENIVLHRAGGEGRAEAIRSAIHEIRKPLIGSTVTPIVVFLPLIAIAGVTGVFFRALAITIAMALLTSLALALTWTPALSRYFLERRVGSGQPAGGKRHLGRALRVYERTLRSALAHPVWVTGFLVVLAAGSYVCYRSLGTDLLPTMDEGGFILDYIMPAGSSLADTNRSISEVESMLRSTPEVAGASRRTGLQLGLAQVTEANTGDIAVRLRRNRSRGVEDIIAELRAKITNRLPVLQVEFMQLLQDMIGDLTSAPEPVEIKLFSQNPALLREWAPRVAERIRRIPGLVDVLNGIDNTISGPALTLKVDAGAAARAGFTPDEVEVGISAVIQGEPAPPAVVVNDRTYTIRVRYPEQSRETVEDIGNALLVSAAGKTATVGSLAQAVPMPGQEEIRRENLQRDVAVTARLEATNLGSAIAAVKNAVRELNLPPSIRVEYGGAYREQQRSFRDLATVLTLAIVLVFIVLLFEFGSFAAPVAILASALLSTSGVFLALLAARVTFNISSFMGLIMVVGIVAKNGILLLDADQRFRHQGDSPFDAMIHAGERRLRPILMTALATVAGMIPLALGLGAGSQMLQPLAIAVIGGVLASMLLSLVVTPAVHYFLTRNAGV